MQAIDLSNLIYTFKHPNENTWVAIIYYDNMEFYGQACCHEEDSDFRSELVGKNLALDRATIEVINYNISKVKSNIHLLSDLIYSYDQLAPKVSIKDLLIVYSPSMKQMQQHKTALKQLRELKKEYKNHITKTIAQKDMLYKKLREQRKNKTE